MLNSIFRKWAAAAIAISIGILLILTLSINWLVQRDFYKQELNRLNDNAGVIVLAHEQYQEGIISLSEFRKELKQIEKNVGVKISIFGEKVKYSNQDTIEAEVRPNVKKWISSVRKGNLVEKIAKFEKREHEKMLIVGFPLKRQDKIAAAAFVYTPTADVKHVAEPIRRSIWIVALAVAGPLIILLWMATRRFVRPIQEMSKAAASVANGDFSSRVQINGHDEVALLGSSFNQMAERIESVEDQRKRLITEIAHELRTPLTSIRGTLQAVQDGIFSTEEQSEFIDISLKEVLRMRNLIDHIGELSAFEEHQISFEFTSVNVVELIEQTVLQLRPKSEALGIKLQIDNDQGNTLLLRADPARMRQVLINLIGNAMEHNRSGTTVSIRLSRVQQKVNLFVRDDGQGIAPEHVPHLFERLYKAESSRSSGGSGLGLTITKHIIQAHGGTIKMTSKLGIGTEVYMEFPIIES